jgi:hypothetical protein
MMFARAGEVRQSLVSDTAPHQLTSSEETKVRARHNSTERGY